MSWQVSVKTAKDEFFLDFEDEALARAALNEAKLHMNAKQGVVTIADQLVVPAADIVSARVYERSSLI